MPTWQFSQQTASQSGFDGRWLAVHPAGPPVDAVVEPDGPVVPVGFRICAWFGCTGGARLICARSARSSDER